MDLKAPHKDTSNGSYTTNIVEPPRNRKLACDQVEPRQTEVKGVKISLFEIGSFDVMITELVPILIVAPKNVAKENKKDEEGWVTVTRQKKITRKESPRV
ncbi:hypothetical protein H6P81_016181 [Aristolochia fimbriata]|uniref:Uncharacterized protein n=1 Tax=Aristolochia fimbriata TaxID=158543 RepID=A0AAV7EAM5_ARIFI|nr:hypothetical protein H6P81_016181 [Aristolochia fimbriata]